MNKLIELCVRKSNIYNYILYYTIPSIFTQWFSHNKRTQNRHLFRLQNETPNINIQYCRANSYTSVGELARLMNYNN